MNSFGYMKMIEKFLELKDNNMSIKGTLEICHFIYETGMNKRSTKRKWT